MIILGLLRLTLLLNVQHSHCKSHLILLPKKENSELEDMCAHWCNLQIRTLEQEA